MRSDRMDSSASLATARIETMPQWDSTPSVDMATLLRIENGSTSPSSLRSSGVSTTPWRSECRGDRGW